MNDYLYVSDGDAHLLNAKRLSARARRVNPDSLLESLFECIARDGWVYIAANVLLLDDYVLKNSSDNPLQVYAVSIEVDDLAIKEVVASLFEDSLLLDKKIGLLKISRASIPRPYCKPGVSVEQFHGMACLPMPDQLLLTLFKSNLKLLQFIDGITEFSSPLLIAISFRQWREAKGDIIQSLITKQWRRVIVKTEVRHNHKSRGEKSNQVDTYFADGSSARDIEIAIDRIFASIEDCNDDSEVYVRPQLLDIASYGFCTTRSIKNNSPYYVISHDRDLTRGLPFEAADSKVLYVHRKSDLGGLDISGELKTLIKAIRELEALFCQQPLKVGFILEEDTIALVSVQILELHAEQDDALVNEKLDTAKQFFEEVTMRGFSCQQANDAYKAIPRWGVQKTITAKPKPLEFSLCQYLSRLVESNSGGRGVLASNRSRYAMVKIGGSPYVSMGASSKDLADEFEDPKLIDKLFRAHLKLLEKNKNIEGIENLSWFPGVDQWLNQQYGDFLSSGDLKEIDRQLRQSFADRCCRTNVYSSSVDSFEPQFAALLEADLPVLTKASAFFDLSHHYTRKPLDQISRNAFISARCLKALFEKNIISQGVYKKYIEELNESSEILSGSAYRVREGKLSKIDFLEKFGFLRDRPFDIACPIYVKSSLSPLYTSLVDASPPLERMSILDGQSHFKISECLNDNGFSFNAAVFDAFVRSSIQDHKYSRLNFDRYLSYGLEYLAEWGESYGLDREELAFLTISDIQSMLCGDFPMERGRVKELLQGRQIDYQLEGKIELPDTIHSVQDFYYHHR